MKKNVIVMTFIILAVVFFAGCRGNSTSAANIFSINDIQNDPLAFTGEITINGVVSELAQDNPAMFGIENPARRPCCPAFVLPVEYIGNQPMPAIGDEVNVTGSWGDEIETNLFIFQATSFEVRGTR